jgi:hypothetical protein
MRTSIASYQVDRLAPVAKRHRHLDAHKGGAVVMRDREFKRDRHLPTRYERERIFHKDMYNERAFNSFGLCGGEDL